MLAALGSKEKRMILFNQEIVELLNKYFSKGEEYVESILLASYGLNIQFVNLKVQCNERVFASIDGKKYEWNDAPNSGPWGALGRQVAKEAKLKNPSEVVKLLLTHQLSNFSHS